MNHAPKQRPVLVLGTVQLGLKYGIANRSGLPSEATAVALIHRALDAGVRIFDTARAYGDSERRLGIALAGRDVAEVVTKLDPNLGAPSARFEEAVSRTTRSLTISRELLKRDLQTVLLHRAEHRTAFGGAIWECLKSWRENGDIERLGVSVQSPAELLDCLNDLDVEHVQLPFNVLDHRWQTTGCIEALAFRPDIRVNTRSAYLQGLLAAPESILWPTIPREKSTRIIQDLKRAAAATGYQSVGDFALAFVRSQPWIDGVVVGVDTVEQLDLNVRLFNRSIPDRDALVRTILTEHVDEALLDPSNWRTTG